MSIRVIRGQIFSQMKRRIQLLWLFSILTWGCFAQNPNMDFHTLIKSAINSPSKMAMQPDGKILVCGNIHSVGNHPISGLVRINTDGTLDESFQSPIKNWVRDFVAEENSIIICESPNNDIQSDPIIRLDYSGNRDKSFHLDNRIIRDVFHIAVQSDGKYIIHTTDPDLQLTRLNSDGSLDETFETNYISHQYSYSDIILRVQSDDKILILGRFDEFNGRPAKGIVRLNADGTMDDDFVGEINISGGYSQINDIAFQQDGKILLVGSFDKYNDVDAKNIIRLNTDGSVDKTFTISGPCANIFTDAISLIRVTENNKILIVGWVYKNPTHFLTLVRLNEDGQYDSSFLKGEMKNNKASYTLEKPALIQDKSGNIYITGQFIDFNKTKRLCMASTTPNGTLREFNPELGGSPFVRNIKRQTDGKILVCGQFFMVNGEWIHNLARLNADGSLDKAFAQNIGSGPDREIYTIKQQGDKILLGGGFNEFNGNYNYNKLVRLNNDGTIDLTFDNRINGDEIHQIHLLKNNKILIGGKFRAINGTYIHNLALLDSDGSLDPTFNTQDFIPEEKTIQSLAFQSDGKIIAGGSNPWEIGGGFLFRTDDKGQKDETFKFSVDLSSYAVESIAVLNDDRILFGGYIHGKNTVYKPFPIYQLNPDGTLLDKNSLAVNNGTPCDIKVMEDETLILSGQFESVNGIKRNGIAKVSTSGKVLDFDAKIKGWSYIVWSTTLLDNKHLMVAGRFSQVGQHQTFSGLAKINLDNTPPEITNIPTKSILEDSSLSLSFSDLEITDPDNSHPNDFTFTISDGENYSVDGNMITPKANYFGTLSVPVTVNDGADDSAPFALQVEVTPVNDLPKITGPINPLSVEEDKTLNLTLDDLSVTDLDNSYPDDFTMTIGAGENYSVQEGVITPSANYSGTLSVPVTVNDGGDDSDPFTLNIEVTSVNDAPQITATTQTFAVEEEGTISLTLDMLKVEDPDNIYPDQFTLSVVSGENYSVNDNTITPKQDYNGTLKVPITVNDGNDDSRIYTLNIEVLPVNDIPQITGVNCSDVMLDGNDLPFHMDQLQITDPDNTFPDDYVLTIHEGEHYTVSENIITAEKDYIGQLTVPLSVNDGTDDSETFNVSIKVISALGIEDLPNQSAISLFPNPAHDRIHVVVDHSWHKTMQISVFNSTGQKVMTHQYYSGEDIYLNIENLSAGMYIILLNNDKNTYKGRFLKN